MTTKYVNDLYSECDCINGRIYKHADEDNQWVPCDKCPEGAEQDPGADIDYYYERERDNE